MPNRAKTSKGKKRSGRLSANQLKGAGLLANGHKIVVIAERCGVDDSTIRRWRQSEPFLAKVREFQRVQEFEIKHELKYSAVEITRNLRSAIAAVADVFNDPEAKPAEVLSAARLSFEMAVKLLPEVDSTSEATPGETKDADFDAEQLQRVRERVYGIYD